MATPTNKDRNLYGAFIYINGIVSSSYIGCFVPSVINYVIPSTKSKSPNEIGAVNTNYLLLSSFIVGISNLMTFPHLNTSPTIHQLTKNVCSFSVILSASVYNYKYHATKYNKKYHYLNIVLNSFLLLSSIASIYHKASNTAIQCDKIDSISKLLQQCQRDGIKYIRFEMPNISGQPLGMIVPMRQCEDFVRKGFPFVSIAGYATANNNLDICEHFTQSGFRNVAMFVELSSYKVIPWHPAQYKTASLIMAQAESANDIYPIDCRVLTLRLLNKLNNTYNYDILSSFEHEFYLLNADGKAVSLSGCYKMDRMSIHQALFCKIDEYLYSMGINCERLHSEVSGGQYEITALPTYNIKSPDDAFWIRNGVREICTIEKNWNATFVTHLASSSDGEFNTAEDDNNGLHLNHSLYLRNGTKENVLWDDDKKGISQIGLYWIGGILHHIESITALCCPTTICYESRFESPWVSKYGDWGIYNRTALIRVKPHKNNTHFEFRLPSSLANPYLILSSVICAGMIGIQNKIVPPKEKRIKTENDEKEPTQCYTTKIPQTLDDALNALENDKVFAQHFDESFIDTYIKVKRIEIKEMKQFKQNKRTPLLYSLF